MSDQSRSGIHRLFYLLVVGFLWLLAHYEKDITTSWGDIADER